MKQILGEKRVLSITPSKLSDYLICPLKYKLRHLGSNRNRESSPALAFGNSVHQALQSIHNQERFVSSQAEATELLKKFWDRSAFPNAEEESEYFDKGRRSLEIYCREAAKSQTRTLGTEVFMSLIIDFQSLKIRLGCKADRLALHPDKTLEIVDYKTSRTGKVATLDFLQNDLPTFLYYVLVRLKYPQYPQIKITFLNVITMTKTTVEYDAELIAKNKQALWNCLKMAAVDKYLPRTSEACAWCQYQDDCPASNEIFDYRSI